MLVASHTAPSPAAGAVHVPGLSTVLVRHSDLQPGQAPGLQGGAELVGMKAVPGKPPGSAPYLPSGAFAQTPGGSGQRPVNRCRVPHCWGAFLTTLTSCRSGVLLLLSLPAGPPPGCSLPLSFSRPGGAALCQPHGPSPRPVGRGLITLSWVL